MSQDKKDEHNIGMDILGFAKNVMDTTLAISKDVVDKVADYTSEVTGTMPHNVIHCGSKDSIIRCPVSYHR